MKKIVLALAVVLCLMSAQASACDGHFESRSQTICVCCGHYERYWDGCRWVSYYTPPRYETRIIQVWIPERHGGGTFDIKVNWNWRTW